MISNDKCLRLVRKILGTRGIKIIRNTLGTILPLLKIVQDPTTLGKDECISAFVRVKDEETWLEPSLLSVKDLVYEYIVIDSSVYDNSPHIIEQLYSSGLNIKHIRDLDPDPVSAWNRGLKHVTCKWILVWDPDFIAKEEMIPYISNTIKELDPHKYYNIYWPHICLDGDLYHQSPTGHLHIEHWLVSFSNDIKFIHMRGFYGFLYTPIYYKRIDISKPLSFHLRTVKPPLRLLYRKYHKELAKKGLLGKVDLNNYIKSRIKEEFNTESIEEAANMYFKQFFKSLIPYNRRKYGDYPRILKEYVKRKFGIIL